MYASSWPVLTNAEALNRLGIQQKIAAAVLDSKILQIHSIGSSYHGLMDTLHVSYLALKHLLDSTLTGNIFRSCTIVDEAPSILPVHTVRYRAKTSAEVSLV